MVKIEFSAYNWTGSQESVDRLTWVVFISMSPECLTIFVIHETENDKVTNIKLIKKASTFWLLVFIKVDQSKLHYIFILLQLLYSLLMVSWF